MDPAARRSVVRRTARSLSRALDAIDEAVWVINSDHELIFISGAGAAWLKITAEELIGRKCHVATARGSRHDEIAAALAPPLGLQVGSAIVAVAEPAGVPPRQIRYMKLGQEREQLILAVSGAREFHTDREELDVASRIRARLNQWRRQNAAVGLIAAAGSSAHALRLRQQVLLASATRQNLGIVGPRGCGSEAIAKRIHAAPVASGLVVDPIITVDTPLMDAELLEATLSPAAAHVNDESNQSVTLLLRGVDESPLDVQQRIMDFAVANGSAVRLIGLLTHPASSPTEPATLTPPMALALSVLELFVAPLAIRCEDIPLIASAIVDSRHAAGACIAERISRAAQDRLLLYPWPGNLDELDAAMRHATSVCRTAAIQPEDLPLAVRSYRLHPAQRKRSVVATTLDEAMKHFELEKIREALDVASGNRSEAARLLGISRGRLIRRLGGEDAAGDDAADGHDSQQQVEP